MKKCRVCSKEISNNRKYCSNSCKEKHRYNSTIYIKECSVCGEEFPATKGMSTCSPECSLKSQHRYEKVCVVCKNTFLARGNGLYCSDMCYRTANSSTKGLMVTSCEVCNKQFRTLKSNPEATCSDLCSSKLFSTYINRVHTEVFGTSDASRIKSIIKRSKSNED